MSAVSYIHAMEEKTGIEQEDCVQIAKITTVGSPEGLWPLPSYRGFLSRLTVLAMNFFCHSGLKSSQNLVGYPYNRHATISPVGTSFLAGWYRSSYRGSQLHKTVADFSTPGACIAPSGNVEASHGAQAFSSISTKFLCHAKEVYCVFSNRVSLPSVSGQSRTMARVQYGFWVSISVILLCG